MVKGKPLAHLLAAIREGHYDNGLDTVLLKVKSSIEYRRDELARIVLLTLEEGDRVQIRRIKTLRPEYMYGKVGEVHRLDGLTVWVQLDTPINRKTKTIARVGVPAWALEVIE